MRLGEILDGSFNIYRRHFGLFMRLSLILVWLPTAAGIYFKLRFGNNPFMLLALFQENLARTFGFGLLALVIWSVCILLLTAGTIRIISDSYLGQEPELGASLRLGVEKIVPLIVVAVSKGLLLIILEIVCGFGVAALFFMGKIGGAAMGVLLAVLGGSAAVWFVVWVACAYGITTPIVVLEDLSSAFDAFGRLGADARCAGQAVRHRGRGLADRVTLAVDPCAGDDWGPRCRRDQLVAAHLCRVRIVGEYRTHADSAVRMHAALLRSAGAA